MRSRFFTRMKERNCVDAQERAAMLQHRLVAIEYQQRLIDEGYAHYAFFNGDDCDEAIIMYEVESHEKIDWLIKRDPHFAYTSVVVVPVVGTEALVREAQDYLGEEIFRRDELHELNFPRRPVNLDGEYWLAWKECLPFSPLCPTEVQNDVYRRTVLAQRGHFDRFEFADDNPIGRPIGILVAEADRETVEGHVRSCEVFPDTIVTYSRLWTLKQAWWRTVADLRDLRRPAPDKSPFDDMIRVVEAEEASVGGSQ